MSGELKELGIDEVVYLDVLEHQGLAMDYSVTSLPDSFVRCDDIGVNRAFTGSLPKHRIVEMLR